MRPLCIMWMVLIGISAQSSRIASRMMSTGMSMPLFFSSFDNLLFHHTQIATKSVLPRRCSKASSSQWKFNPGHELRSREITFIPQQFQQGNTPGSGDGIFSQTLSYFSEGMFSINIKRFEHQPVVEFVLSFCRCHGSNKSPFTKQRITRLLQNALVTFV